MTFAHLQYYKNEDNIYEQNTELHIIKSVSE